MQTNLHPEAGTIRVAHKGKDLWASTTFIAPDTGETVVTIGSPKESINIIFDISVSTDSPTMVEFVADHPQQLRIKLVNWNEVNPATLQQPAEVGEFLDRRLSLIFSCVKLGSHGQIRQIHLNLYLGEVANGKD
jgi:hypothetical protein